MLRVYLDNCCYNRPYDDQTQLRISLESQAKLHVQKMIRNDRLELVASYMLTFENEQNRYEAKRKAIQQFLEAYTSVYVGSEYHDQVETIAQQIQSTGVKTADAIHTACAIIAQCDYLLTTDDRLLKYKTDRIQIVNPMEFVRLTGGENDEYN